MDDALRLEPCSQCDKQACRAVVILSSLPTSKRQFDKAANCLHVKCPACDRPFSASIFALKWLEVDEFEFNRGYRTPMSPARGVKQC